MLKIDFSNMFSTRLQDGLKTEDLETLSVRMNEFKAQFNNEKGSFGFTKLPSSFKTLKSDLDKSNQWAENMRDIVVVGIGGSDLGARAIYSALKFKSDKLRNLYFMGDTTDPDAISEAVSQIDLSKSLFLIISKSGNTIEQASNFVYLRDLVIQKLGKGEELNHFIFLTDEKSGTLREIANNDGYKTISVPSDVGGRYSVLSSVGMVPSYLVRLNVEDFLKGASDLDMQNSAMKYNEDLALKYAALQFLYYKSGKNISVLMPYRYSLYEFAKWFRQLWAESLGKRLNNKGNEVFEGITPVAALGPTDQHSQLQLYNEGPNDKVITILGVQNSNNDIDLPNNFSHIEQYEFLKGKKFSEILKTEMQATSYILTKNSRPNCTITIDKLDEYHLGQLFYFYEVSCVYLGYFLEINPFDQPGVELQKDTVYGILGEKGYVKEKQDFDNFIKS